MRKEYDFTAAKKNPYATQLKKQITIQLDEESIGYSNRYRKRPAFRTRVSSIYICEIALLISASSI